MAKKSSGSALGLLLLFAPVVWVCSACTGNDRPPPPRTEPIASPSSPSAAPMPAEPVVPSTEPTPEPAPDHGKHRAHAEPRKSPDPTAERRRPPSATADTPSLPTCCKHCSASSKPCGDSCISLSKTCHKGRGCAC